ncbi:hypothetical protein UG55_100212 [Frankia sp. EI5c]|uniref:hypothetical protein n=1 Tax=Frankia sp. EI5c TaxID=683316 RepID=UPI0007C27C48|nr:hypothetical protein [Frankia sp. EI5c]OAA29381.1 hypothetical protein UG55_100212 [Frankia sp. EI5c]
MNLHLSDRSGLYRKLAARRAVRRQRHEFDLIIESADTSPALRQEIEAIYARQNAGIPAQGDGLARRDSGVTRSRAKDRG